MQVYTVNLDTNTIKLNAEVIQLAADRGEALDAEIHYLLNSSGYDFWDYSDEIAILVDDHGFFKEGLPVFEIESEYGDFNKLAGKLLFVRNVENEDSTDIGSIKFEDIFKLKNQMNIKFVGFTKGVS